MSLILCITDMVGYCTINAPGGLSCSLLLLLFVVDADQPWNMSLMRAYAVTMTASTHHWLSAAPYSEALAA
jgi:hypothetical protein